MCTASWLIRSAGYEVLFNRDEARGRGPGRPPRVTSVRGVRVLAPVDSDAGGTWIGVNELGLTACLLNARSAGAGAAPDPGTWVSRGRLLRQLLGAASAADLGRQLRARPLGEFRGFRVAVFEPGGSPAVWRWDGRVLTPEEARLPLVSSGVAEPRARECRARVLARMAGERGGPHGQRGARHRRGGRGLHALRARTPLRHSLRCPRASRAAGWSTDV